MARRDDRVVLIAIAFALITVSACGAGWSASGWREGASRAVLAVVVAGGALRLGTAAGVAATYVIGGAVALLGRAFVIVPIIDATMMPDMMGPSPGVRAELAATLADPAQALWWASFDVAMLIPIAVLLGEVRRAPRGTSYLVIGAWLAALAALDVILTWVSDHGRVQCVLAVVAAVVAVPVGMQRRRLAGAAVPAGAIGRVVLALGACVLLWAAIQYTGYCEHDAFRLECALHA